MGVFLRSWEITKLSFGVIKKDKEMLLFPILAGISSLAFMAAMIFPQIMAFIATAAGSTESVALNFSLIFITYFGLAFIMTFFNVCVVYTAKIRFENGDATFMDSIKFAFSKIHLIAMWSVVSATVGIILRIIDMIAQRMGLVGKIILMIIRGILGMIWSIITIFVVPSLVYHGLGPFAAIKKSVQVLKKTWGESLIRYYGLGMIQFLFILLGSVIGLGLLYFGISIQSTALILIAVFSLIIYIIFVALVFNVANTVFNTALYVYADTGKIPRGFNQQIMSNAFKDQKKK